jgi:hypothetical protein
MSQANDDWTNRGPGACKQGSFSRGLIGQGKEKDAGRGMDRTMTSMWSQSAPRLTMRSASAARLAKSDESMDGAIFAAAAMVGASDWTCWLSGGS